MKKILIYAAMAAASLTAFSCQGVVQEPETGNDVLVLTLDSGDMETKSADTSFETAIDHFDFFFFSDAEGTAPIPGMHGRAEGSSKVLNTQEGAEFAALRSVTSYVYILANYPSALDHSADWTLAQLLALEVDSKIVTEKKTETNPITGDVEETGEVTYASNLVMDSWQEVGDDDVYTVELTPAKIQEQRNVTVGLSRLAAKITVEITVVPSVTVGGNVWKSHPEVLTAYYVNALNNKATVLATPVKRSALTDETGYEYLTYPQAYPMTPAPAADVYKYTTDPVYTYPQEWSSDDNGEPYLKLQMPWVNDNGDGALSMGSANIYYKATVPQPGTDGKWTIERNKWYKVSLTLSMLNTVEDYGELEFDCTVVPWAESGWKGGSGLSSARFFDVPTREFTLFNDANLDIPFSSSSTVNAYITKVSYFYYGDTNGANHECVFNYTKEDNITSLTLPTTDSNGYSLPAAARETNVYSVSTDSKKATFSHPLSNIYTRRIIELVLENQDGRQATIHITQLPAIEIKKNPTKNAFVNGWFGRASADVKDDEGNLLGVSYSPTTYGGLPNPAFHNTSNWSTSSYINNLNSLGTVYGSSSSSVRVSSIFTVEIKISAFEEGKNKYDINYVNGDNYNSATGTVQHREYKIGDPRVPASNYFSSLNLGSYLRSDKTHRDNPETTDVDESSTGTDLTGTWEDPVKILMANQGVDANEVIAPHFLVSSQLNVLNVALSHNNSARRAMTYQENGYPAGRWRLPTEAEIAFIVARQKDGNIPWLFADTYYHCANGKMAYVSMQSADANKPPIFCNHTSGYNRFIYDLWYWGEDPTEGVDTIHTADEMTDWEKAMSEDGVTPNWKAHWAEYYHPNMHEH